MEATTSSAVMWTPSMSKVSSTPVGFKYVRGASICLLTSLEGEEEPTVHSDEV